MEANYGKLVRHTYDTLDHGTSVCEERSTDVNRVVAGGRVLSGFQFSQH